MLEVQSMFGNNRSQLVHTQDHIEAFGLINTVLAPATA